MTVEDLKELAEQEQERQRVRADDREPQGCLCNGCVLSQLGQGYQQAEHKGHDGDKELISLVRHGTPPRPAC